MSKAEKQQLYLELSWCGELAADGCRGPHEALCMLLPIVRQQAWKLLQQRCSRLRLPDQLCDEVLQPSGALYVLHGAGANNWCFGLHKMCLITEVTMWSNRTRKGQGNE